MRSDVSDSGIAVLALDGEHDIYTAPQLRDRLGELVEAGPGLVVDLSGATFIDSSILGALLNARQQAIDAKKGFAVCLKADAEPAVRRVFDMTGLTTTLPVVQDLQTATRAAAEGPPRSNDAGSDG